MYWKKLLNWSKAPDIEEPEEIKGSKINLRSKKIEDAEQDYEWRSDQELSALDATVPINISLREYISHFKDELKYPVPWSVKYAIEDKNGYLIGNIMYYDIDPIEKEAEIGIIIGNKAFLSKGFGTDALHTLVSHVFDTTNIMLLYLHTLTTNHRAIKAFKKVGFKEVGPVRKEGMNFIKMDLLKNDWEKINPQNNR
ncbi:MAG: GNAT family N-acetyltransferase [Chloroflexota bacterium]|nr:GNAT family N-acetyltransferase [Chloroflexota bacterium]